MNPLWQPRSACGPHCLPGPRETPTVSRLHQAGRLTALFGALLFGALLVPVLPVLPAAGRQAAGRWWARLVLGSLGVTLQVRGRLPRRRALLAANHISWLDIMATLAVAPARMLAKQEVRQWPLIGPLAASGGTIFVNRTRPRALPQTVAKVAEALRSDRVVAVFPEGTTWCGKPRAAGACPAGGRFRPAMFQAAIDAGAPVVPLTINYRTGPGRDGTTAAAFLGEDSLWVSLRRVLAVRGLSVTVTAAPALHPEQSASRRRLAQAAESAVRFAGPPTPHRHPTPLPTPTPLAPTSPSGLSLAA
ncbi:lysophospholipid acyltransferase family protein [Micromonospora sp. NBC_01796]|uniref:lysophospholipid acyltransferase family protein n=1 Tax=Micromonospora sp. NBC_01796 TaxID=2975987 RepID=UPI002DD9F85A|nr:lysophospholipid acyltransferase family protein [Micromonospora sp. NBC_01796]WSA89444.1 1-acyl-sn-glycerol-3-phosphate acyltransferase [Micromonospora sp. NBC_01796]